MLLGGPVLRDAARRSGLEGCLLVGLVPGVAWSVASVRSDSLLGEGKGYCCLREGGGGNGRRCGSRARLSGWDGRGRVGWHLVGMFFVGCAKATSRSKAGGSLSWHLTKC